MKYMKILFFTTLFILLLNTVSAWTFYCPYPVGEAWLYTDIQIDGDYSSPQDIPVGEEFELGVWVDNAGWRKAYDVIVKLENIPDDWTTETDLWEVGDLSHYDGEWKEIMITRGQTNAEIYANASACNAFPVISNKISIPIFWITLLVLVLIGTFVTIKHFKK